MNRFDIFRRFFDECLAERSFHLHDRDLALRENAWIRQGVECTKGSKTRKGSFFVNVTISFLFTEGAKSQIPDARDCAFNVAHECGLGGGWIVSEAQEALAALRERGLFFADRYFDVGNFVADHDAGKLEKWRFGAGPGMQDFNLGMALALCGRRDEAMSRLRSAIATFEMYSGHPQSIAMLPAIRRRLEECERGDAPWLPIPP